MEFTFGLLCLEILSYFSSLQKWFMQSNIFPSTEGRRRRASYLFWEIGCPLSSVAHGLQNFPFACHDQGCASLHLHFFVVLLLYFSNRFPQSNKGADTSLFWVAVRTFSMPTSPGKLAFWANVFISHLSMLWLKFKKPLLMSTYVGMGGTWRVKSDY